MKKSKIVLVAGTLILAAAGAMAAKVTYRAQTVFYSTGAGVQTIQIDDTCTLGGTGCVTTIGSSVNVQLYNTTDENGLLTQPLRPIE